MFHAGITDTFIEPERFYPGAHVFFVGSCRDVCVFEDAGFELRDCVFDFGGGLLWWLLRRPVVGTVAANVLNYGVGAINIDGSRIGTEQRDVTITEKGFGSNFMDDGWQPSGKTYEKSVTGRWPANIILDPYTAQLLDEQSGVSVSKQGLMGSGSESQGWGLHKRKPSISGHNDSGGASRFFYVAQQPQDLIQYLTNLILPPNGKLFFQLKEQETNDR